MPPRRSNKSAKVPNVKLRPAAPAARRSKDDDTLPPMWVHAPGSDADMDASFVDVCPRPFRGVVLCATGISDKTSLFKQAIELGATCIQDLTDKVTHLLAEGPGSAKYRCALENKVSIMQTSWITECHEIWLRGDDVDVEESVENHRLPVFTGVILCLSGIEDVARRTEINRLVRAQGGTYVKNLERPIKVTHLLCSSTQEEITEKMKYAEKFNQRGEANIQLVWEEWFWDSLEFGGRFDEQAYQVSKPRPKRRSLPEPATSPLRSSSPAEEPPNASQRVDLSNLLMDDGDEEIASVKRVPLVTLQIWESLLKPRGFEIKDGRLVHSPSKAQSAAASAELGLEVRGSPPREASPTRTQKRVESKSLSSSLKRKVGPGGAAAPTSALSSFSRANSFAPAPQNTSARQPFQRAPTVAASSSPFGRRAGSVGDGNAGSSQKRDDGEAGGASAGPSSMFKGMRFRALGEARCQNVRASLEECGGAQVADDEPDEDVDFIIVRLISGSSLYQAEEDERVREKYRTECWLERCIFEERVCAPSEHISFAPLGIRIPIPGAERINLSFSGLDQSEGCWVRRLMRALGGSIAPNFSRRSTHLLCPSGVGVKAEKAREWGVPIVDMTWLAEMARTGAVLRVDARAGVSPECAMEARGESSSPRAAANPKGKGKERMLVDDADTDAPAKEQLAEPPGADPPALFPVAHPVEEGDTDAFGVPGALLDLGSEAEWQLASATSLPSAGTQPVSERAPSLGRILVEATRDSSMFAAETVTAGPPHAGETGAEMELELRLTDDRAQDADADERMERIPSSASPSPLKMPPRGGSRSGSAPVSPSKGTLARTPSTLQEGLTSLLGKRPSVEEEPSPAVAEVPGSGSKAKRPRPTSRAKPPSSGTADCGAGERHAFGPYMLGEEDNSMVVDGQLVEDLRVTYRDAEQDTERKRLMGLLSSEEMKVWEAEAPQKERSMRAKRKGRRSARGAAS